jgi:pimeloyl-ACP methyl ester carboxylesterase
MTKEEIESDPIQVAPVLDAIKRGDSEFYKNLWNAAIYTAGNTPDPEDYNRYIDEMLLQRNLVDIDYALTRFNMSDTHNGYVQGSGDIHKVKCPVTIVQGDKDVVVPMAMAQGINEALKDNSKLIILENSGHNPMVDSFDQVVSIIKEF